MSLSTTCWGAEESLLLLATCSPVPVLVVAPRGELLDRAAAAGVATRELTDARVLRCGEVGTRVGPATTGPVLAVAARALAAAALWGSAGPVVSFSQWLHLPLALAGRLRGAPVALDLHDGPFARAGAAVQSAAAWTATRSVAVSATTLAHLRSWPHGRVTVVPRPVVLPPGLSGADRRLGDTDGGRPLRLAVVGRLDPEKRVEVALEAHALLVAAGVPATLDVVGAPHRGQARDLLSPGRWPTATFHGRLAHEDALAVVARADLLLSTAPGEAFGRTVVEAALLGVPAIVSGGGPAELVEHGRTGFHVTPGEPRTLADLLARCAADRPGLFRTGTAARREALERCAPGPVATAWARAVGA